ncbi:MAG: hypothetical protein ACTSVV_17635 [Promethearchaeota archaeon]
MSSDNKKICTTLKELKNFFNELNEKDLEAIKKNISKLKDNDVNKMFLELFENKEIIYNLFDKQKFKLFCPTCKNECILSKYHKDKHNRHHRNYVIIKCSNCHNAWKIDFNVEPFEFLEYCESADPFRGLWEIYDKTINDELIEEYGFDDLIDKPYTKRELKALDEEVPPHAINRLTLSLILEDWGLNLDYKATDYLIKIADINNISIDGLENVFRKKMEDYKRTIWKKKHNIKNEDIREFITNEFPNLLTQRPRKPKKGKKAKKKK